jgi:predicted N-acyltransferase
MHIEPHYVIQVLQDPADLSSFGYDALLSCQDHANPFLTAAYFQALHQSGSATPETGWDFRCIMLLQEGQCVAACPGYIKTHSAGEYVFDQAWAQAYARHGLAYYPKFMGAPAFTPVPGNRLVARDALARGALIRALEEWAEKEGLSSLHLLFATEQEARSAVQAGWLQRNNVQFHWQNRQPNPYESFEAFLTCLHQEKRKKIRQEQKKVIGAGVHYQVAQGRNISASHWSFFYECYQRTYFEHGRPPYLNPGFFDEVARTLPDNWVLFTALREGRPIACSLLGLSQDRRTAYGRYWGALERVDCLHFDVCYYQAIRWCIDHQVQRFEGGAQGEHKMARALLPCPTQSVHWIADTRFRQAIANYLAREEVAVGHYLDELQQRTPFKSSPHRP